MWINNNFKGLKEAEGETRLFYDWTKCTVEMQVCSSESERGFLSLLHASNFFQY